ncbi:MAG TPA: DUF349 domain-containing protein [Microbacteriaceae bacterium]|nr:DUF349 domain-containing protein [Microbacteriaceae bacterium]
MNYVINENPWGRVDDTNTVYVKESSGERAVGQYPDGTAEEALAYFVRKFDDLEGQVRLAEQRIITGSAGTNIASTVENLITTLKAPAAVGDLDSLRERATKLKEKAEGFVKEQQQLKAEQKQIAVAEREAIVVEAEKLANQPESSIRWKETSESMELLFTKWQEAQRTGTHIGKSQADELWKRFRAARNTFENARRRFFAQIDATNKTVKQRKESLIAQAEALASQGADGIPQYRKLLDDWKQSGRASKKLDDQLWVRFKAAGDVLYEVKAAERAKIDEEYEANLKVKLEILEKAAPILEEQDYEKARKMLTPILESWDAAGKVPRASVKSVEDKIRNIERHVQKLEEDHWAATNPETIARSEGLRGQLEDSISTLSKEIEAAESAGDVTKAKKLNEQLTTQKSWLDAIS